MANLPTGTVIFLFTDIEGSTALWERDQAATAAVVERHIARIRAAVAAHHGVLFKVVGDGTQAAFSAAPDAIAAAIEAQRALLAEDWGAIRSLRVRMALHAGQATPDPHGDFLAAPLNRLARLLAVGHGAQILLSETVRHLARGALPAGAELRDLGEHRLRDLLEPERVFQVLHPDLPADFPPLTSLELRPHNLPLQPTPFLGRENEVAAVLDLLQRPDVRLVTLTGPGGTGKTRLAIQAAAEALDVFPDGAFFVPLASIADPSLIPSAIGGALGVRDEGEISLMVRLREALALKRLLLILDNVEHLVESAPAVGELVAACPALKVLATSRIPLRLRAEHEFPVPPLGLPRRKPPPTLEQLSQFEAVRLFIDRAQAVKPDFVVDNENAPAVAEICHRLDGLPLAIELAVARIRVLPPRAMLARLEQRLPLLAGGARDAPTRQRTLRDTIAWSYDLLEPQDQILFHRIAVFVGGCAWDAAEAVGNHDARLDVLGGVERLCEQSLLRQDAGSTGEPRFSMLETIREFAIERLAANGDEPASRDAHASAMLTLCEAAALHLEGPDQGIWTERLETDYPNIREAVGWLRRWGQDEKLLRLGASIKWFLFNQHTVEARQWLAEALIAAGEVPWQLRADALYALGHLARSLSDTHQAVALHQEELALRQEAGDDAGLGRVLLALGTEMTELGDPAAADDYLHDGLIRLRAANDRWGIGLALSALGGQARARGDIATAAMQYEEALRMHRSIGDSYHIAVSLAMLAVLNIEMGDLDQAQNRALTALAAMEQTGLEHMDSIMYCVLTEVALARDDRLAAEDHAHRALETAQASGDQGNISSVLGWRGSLAHRWGDDREAIGYLRGALDAIPHANDAGVLALYLEALTSVAADHGLARQAARLLGAAIAVDPGIAVFRLPSEQIAYERASVTARTILGEEAFTATYDSGRELNRDEALAEARVVVDELAGFMHQVATRNASGKTVIA